MTKKTRTTTIEAAAMSPEDMKALVHRHIEEGFNHGDWNVCQQTLTDDYTARYGADGNANVGRDHYVMVCKMLRKSFPNVAITIEDLVVEGDKIVNRYIERGTLSGRSFLGIEPAGQRYEKPGTTIYRVADGRLAESWGVEDTLGWFRQLGKYTE
jgi:predicted ester cyclase